MALPLYYKKISRKNEMLLLWEYLDKMGLKDLAMHYPTNFRGGQNNNIAIARALIANPRVILADEPTECFG